MNTATLRGFRLIAESMTSAGRYRLVDADGRTIVFDLPHEQAQEYRHYYPGSCIVPMDDGTEATRQAVREALASCSDFHIPPWLSLADLVAYWHYLRSLYPTGEGTQRLIHGPSASRWRSAAAQVFQLVPHDRQIIQSAFLRQIRASRVD